MMTAWQRHLVYEIILGSSAVEFEPFTPAALVLAGWLLLAYRYGRYGWCQQLLKKMKTNKIVDNLDIYNLKLKKVIKE